jgi:hypothetical protein
MLLYLKLEQRISYRVWRSNIKIFDTTKFLHCNNMFGVHYYRHVLYSFEFIWSLLILISRRNWFFSFFITIFKIIDLKISWIFPSLIQYATSKSYLYVKAYSHLYQFLGTYSFLRGWKSFGSSRKSALFMEPKGLLPCSQEHKIQA